MTRKWLFIVLALSVAVGPYLAQWTDLKGNILPEEPWRKTVQGFGAQLLLSDSPNQFVQSWASKKLPVLNMATTVKRNNPCAAFLIITNPKEVQGKCNVVVSYDVYGPDGKVFQELHNVPAWVDHASLGKDIMHLCPAACGLRLSNKFALGEYRIKGVVRDVNANIDVELNVTFKLID